MFRFASPRRRPLAERADRLRWAVPALVLVALPVSIGFTVVVLQDSIARQTNEALGAGRQAAVALAHEMSLREHVVEVIVGHAEQFLEGRVRPTVDVVEFLEPQPAHGGYSMRLPPGQDPARVGSLMGEGPLPDRGSETAREMSMAFALSADLRALQGRDAQVPWAYYISRRGFLYMYPRVAAGEFLWSHAFLDRYYERSGIPRARSDGPVSRWLAPYEDAAGEGLVTTLNARVVQRGEYAGDVGVDVRMSTLLAVLDTHAVTGSFFHLLDAAGHSMLARRPLPGPIDPTTAPHGRAFDVGGAEVAVFPVGSSGWFVAVETPRRAMAFRALRGSVVFGLMVLFVFASLVLLVLLARAMRSLVAVSVRDSLTGVYNRRHFDDSMKGEIAKARRAGSKLALAIVDVDHFKKYNDRYGHHAGDRVLRAVAQGLRGSLQRASDALFRVGGEEFAVVAYLDRPEQLQALGDKLTAAIRKLEIEHLGSGTGLVTISIGTTLINPANGDDLDVAYQRADAALYRAKDAGRDRVELG